MRTTMKRWALAAAFVAVAPALALLGACGKEADSGTNPTTSSTPAVPAPPGDSAPKPADTMTAPAVSQNEKTDPSAPSTVGTAASGAPPYSLQSAPEGNPPPSQGTKDAETKK